MPNELPERVDGGLGSKRMARSYDRIGAGYSRTRVADPRITALIDDALGDAQTIVNVGAGTGNYEPHGRVVTAVEPSLAMIAQHPAGSARVVRAHAESLPFPDQSFDAAMAVWTVHHWSDWRAGVREMRRVSRKRVVIATWDSAFEDAFWFTHEYLPQAGALDAANFPPLDELIELLGTPESRPIPIPRDCTDGFMAAFWARPEALLDPDTRANISTFAEIDPGLLQNAITTLRGDLESGAWERTYGALREQASIDLGYRCIVA